jgi:hypothetical protein
MVTDFSPSAHWPGEGPVIQEITIDDPKFDELLDRVVRALMALDGPSGPKRRPRRGRTVDRRDVAAA